MTKIVAMTALIVTMIAADGLDNNFNNTPSGTVDINISGLGIENQTVTALRFDNTYVYQGDIVLGEQGTSRSRTESGTLHQLSASKRWPGGVIPYVIDDSVSVERRADISQAMSDWEDATGVDFRAVSNQNIDSPTYLWFFTDTSNMCASYVGKAMHSGEQKVWIANWCTLAPLTHELGHALGLYHEQARNDRDNFIQVHYENIQDEYKSQFSKITRSDVGHGVAYNYSSIMHYSAYGASKNDQPTMTAYNGATLGGPVITTGDANAVKFLYSDAVAHIESKPNKVYGATYTIYWSDTPNEVLVTVTSITHGIYDTTSHYDNKLIIRDLPMDGSTIEITVSTETSLGTVNESFSFKSLPTPPFNPSILIATVYHNMLLN